MTSDHSMPDGAPQVCYRETESNRGASSIVGKASDHSQSGSLDAVGLKDACEPLAASAHELVATTGKQIATLEEGKCDYGDEDGPYETEWEIYKDSLLSIAQESYGPYRHPPANRASSQAIREEARINTLSESHSPDLKKGIEANGSGHDLGPSLARVSSLSIKTAPPGYAALADLPGPAEYHRFYWNCMELKSELIRLDFSLRSVGAGGPGVQATHSVISALRKLRDLYGTNTSALFPRDVNVEIYNPGGTRGYLTSFSVSFNKFANAMDEMAQALHDFNAVYHDEKLMLQLFSLHSRFKAEANAISFGNDYRPTSDEFSAKIQTMLEEWVEGAITSLMDAVRTFHEKGIPAIQNAQNNTSSRYLNLTTIAFFLSGTTASMLQISANDSTSFSGVAANTFLFSSLVFSVGSAVNSLLVRGWRMSIVRQPDRTTTSWLSAWFNAGPMISLLIAGAFFAAALCLFVFSTGQHAVTSAITIALSSIHASGLLFLYGYFIQERWKFRKSAGSVGRDLTSNSVSLSVLDWMKSCVESLRRVEAPLYSVDFAQVESGRRSRSLSSTQEFEGPESEMTPLTSPAVWHALSDEKFLLNSKFIYSDDSENVLQGDDTASEPPVRRWSWEVGSPPRQASSPAPASSEEQIKTPSKASAEPADSVLFDGADAIGMADAFREALRERDSEYRPTEEPTIHHSRSFPPYYARNELGNDKDRQLPLSKPTLSERQSDVPVIRRPRSHPPYITRAELDSGVGAHIGRIDFTTPEAGAELARQTSQSPSTASAPLLVSRDASLVSNFSTSSERSAHISEMGESPDPGFLEEELYRLRAKDHGTIAHQTWEVHQESADEGAQARHRPRPEMRESPGSGLLEEELYRLRAKDRGATAHQTWEVHQESADEGVQARHRPRPEMSESPGSGLLEEELYRLRAKDHGMTAHQTWEVHQESVDEGAQARHRQSPDDATRIRRVRVDTIPTEHQRGQHNGTYRAGTAPRRRWDDPHFMSQVGNVQIAALLLPNPPRLRSRSRRIGIMPRPR